MFLIQVYLFLLLFISISQTNLLPKFPSRTSKTTIKTSPNLLVNSDKSSSVQKNISIDPSITQVQNDKISSEDIPTNIDTTAEEIKNEVFVNDLLETVEEQDDINETVSHQGPHYELNWAFMDKDTIRVTFDLYSVPTSLIENSKNSEINRRKLNLLGTLAVMPSRLLKSITLLKYFHYIIRPYNLNREITLKIEKLIIKNTTARKYNHFSNSLRLTALNHHEKYSVCICYYQTNNSLMTPDLLLCQDIINDYAKFSELRTDPKHGLVFITTQYSIILALLVVLQSVFTMRKRRVAQVLTQILSNKAHSIRSTLSSVSLGRQSSSSLDTAAGDHHHHHHHHQQQHHATNGHGHIHHEPTIEEEDSGLKKRIISSPAIVISEPAIAINNGATSSDENEPFLKRIPSKNHVHFLLGPNEGSDDDDEQNTNEHDDITPTLNTQASSSSMREPYDDQADALLSMAHILDTNKPWSRHSHHTSPV